MLLELSKIEAIDSSLQDTQAKLSGNWGLSAFTDITPEAAVFLAQWWQRHHARAGLRLHAEGSKVESYMLDLSGLKTLSQSSAAALAQWNPVHPDAPIDAVACALNLNGLEVAPLNVLEKLAAWSVPCDSASLMLNGLHELNPASAQVLARLSCASFIGLELANVCAITPDSAGALCDGGITWLRLGLRTITPETAAVLGASMIDLISLPKLDRIEAASIYGLAGLGPTGELPEDEGTRSLRNRSLELGDPSSELQDLGPGIKEALEALQQLDVEVIVSPRTADFLAKIE